MNNKIVVFGGAGFIGSNFAKTLIENRSSEVLVVDKLTYAGSLENLAGIRHHAHFHFIRADICDHGAIRELVANHRPRALINFAAESHVDRSIVSPEDFVSTNVLGVFNLLRIAKDYWTSLAPDDATKFRFMQISTDEVYGSLGTQDPPFTEMSNYQPNSPYSATKAASDHLVRAWFHTYGLPTLTTNCSNNYGPNQFPEKLIPFMIHRALSGQSLPIYGDGLNVRDWLYVTDHCNALWSILERGRIGETYNIGGNSEKTNREVVYTICKILDKIAPNEQLKSYKELITFVPDRPGHDRRYAIDPRKLRTELGFEPSRTFEQGLRETIDWYLSNRDWMEAVSGKELAKWVDTNYTKLARQS